jgi:hypothetical protein
MSAFAAEAAFVMTCRSAGSSLPSITARPSAAEKARFTWLAERAGMSESALALMAIRAVLDPDGKAHTAAAAASERGAATDRITVRLRPGDGAAIARRAAQRGMKASTYLAALVRAHVGVNPSTARRDRACDPEAKHRRSCRARSPPRSDGAQPCPDRPRAGGPAEERQSHPRRRGRPGAAHA